MWMRLILILLSVGGGVSGLTSVLVVLFSPAAVGVANVMICLLFVALYAFVITAGLLIVVRPSCMLPMTLALVPQLFFWSTQPVSFRFVSGPWIQCCVANFRIYFGVQIGSEWELRINQPSSFLFGINLLAVLVLTALLSHRLFWSRPHANPGH